MAEEEKRPADATGTNREMDEAQRKLHAKVHRQLGTLAAVLGIVAAIVGFWFIGRLFGVSPWQALREAMPLFVIVLIILGLGVLFSMGTSRIAYGIERLVKKNKKQQAKAGE